MKMLWVCDFRNREPKRVSDRFSFHWPNETCGDASPSPCGFVCLLAKGHTGTHLAGTGGQQYSAEWENESEPYMMVPEGL